MDLANIWTSKFICDFWITKICRISDACSRSKLEFKTFSFKCLVVSNYIVVTLQLFIVKIGEFKEEEIITFWKI